MGASESKPSPAHEWKGTGPTSVSYDLAESLRTSNETDASRARLTEIQIQARVSEELKKLQAQQADTLKKTLSSDDASSAPAEGSRSTQSVNKEIEALRTKLEERRKVRDVPEAVQTARGEVIRCLREHDRRPLDCWEEVEAFKREVKAWERGWVEKVIS